jgi:hypothetical protein
MSTVQRAVRKIGMTAAEQFWYIVGCIAFGVAYLAKVPVKKALSDYGLAEMTAAEQFWYVLGCIAFGSAYFSKVPVAKALSELEQFRVARAAPHDQLGGRAVIEQHQAHEALPEQVQHALPEQAHQPPSEQIGP